mmetsp:Transcript_3441/g.6510  ORF Transcript_3441/g.6510 Transcript_3441/m.6510 type:complete len:239 (-) Transcript_3441:364-1080(-)
MHRVLAAPDSCLDASTCSSSDCGARVAGSDSSRDRFLISSSHVTRSHQGAKAKHRRFNAGTNSGHSLTTAICESRTARLRASMSAWICSSSAGTAVTSSVQPIVTLLPVSRRAQTQCSATISLGPNSTRRGTPFCSQWAYFQPGRRSIRVSTLARTPAAFKMVSISCALLLSASICSGVHLLSYNQMMMTCTGATRGGRTAPLSSPLTRMAVPMERVVNPHDVCHTWCRSLPPSSPSN